MSQNGVRYCSNACRQRAYRKRVKTPGVQGSAAVCMSALTSFVGREHELGEVQRLLRANRLVTIVGPFGVGKTRLAAELAARIQRGGRGEVVVVELGSTTGVEGLAHAMAATFGLLERPGASVIDALVTELNGRGQVHLVLDNCEHILTPCAELLGALLPRLSELTVLATSREPMRVPGEVVFSLSGLESPADAERLSIAACLGSDAVRLFVDRARAARPELEFTNADAASIATVCERLDGIPLAIELAARLLRAYRLTEIRDRLDDRLAILTGGWRTSDHRHHSLRNAIGWSYDLLSARERALFRRLSFVPGRFDVAVAELVADPTTPRSAVFELLSDLEAKSLITTRADTGGFDMLESIRVFGRQQLVAHGEEDHVAERLLGRLVELVSPLVDTVAVPYGLLTLLRDEHENLAHLLDRLAEGADERQLLLAVAMVVSRFNPGYSGLRAKALLDALARVSPASQYRSLALGHAGWLVCLEGDHGEAVRLVGEAIEVERAGAGRPAVLGRLLRLQSHTARRHGDADTTIAALREAAACCREIGDRLGVALCVNDLAWQLLYRSDITQAKPLSDEACSFLDTSKVAGDLRSALLHTAGVIAVELGEHDEAERRFSSALRAASDAGQRADAVEGLAIAALRKGSLDRGLLLAGAIAVFADRSSWRDPWCGARLEEALGLARQALPARSTEALMARGARLRPERIVAVALDERGTADDGAPRKTLLSTREWDVVELVAKGLTNRQIAGTLHLSVRTIEAHVRKIRGTLGLRSRAHLAAWAAQHHVPQLD